MSSVVLVALVRKREPAVLPLGLNCLMALSNSEDAKSHREHIMYSYKIYIMLHILLSSIVFKSCMAYDRCTRTHQVRQFMPKSGLAKRGTASSWHPQCLCPCSITIMTQWKLPDANDRRAFWAEIGMFINSSSLGFTDAALCSYIQSSLATTRFPPPFTSTSNHIRPHPWKPMETYGNLWKPMNYGNRWNLWTMEISGNLRLPLQHTLQSRYKHGAMWRLSGACGAFLMIDMMSAVLQGSRCQMRAPRVYKCLVTQYCTVWDTFQTLRNLEIWQTDANKIGIEFTPCPLSMAVDGFWVEFFMSLECSLHWHVDAYFTWAHLSQHQDITEQHNTCTTKSWEPVGYVRSDFINHSSVLPTNSAAEKNMFRWSSLIDPNTNVDPLASVCDPDSLAAAALFGFREFIKRRAHQFGMV